MLRPGEDAGEVPQHQDQQSGKNLRERMAAAVSAPDGPVAALEHHDYI